MMQLWRRSRGTSGTVLPSASASPPGRFGVGRLRNAAAGGWGGIRGRGLATQLKKDYLAELSHLEARNLTPEQHWRVRQLRMRLKNRELTMAFAHNIIRNALRTHWPNPRGPPKTRTAWMITGVPFRPGMSREAWAERSLIAAFRVIEGWAGDEYSAAGQARLGIPAWARARAASMPAAPSPAAPMPAAPRFGNRLRRVFRR